MLGGRGFLRDFPWDCTLKKQEVMIFMIFMMMVVRRGFGGDFPWDYTLAGWVWQETRLNDIHDEGFFWWIFPGPVPCRVGVADIIILMMMTRSTLAINRTGFSVAVVCRLLQKIL